MASHWLYLLFFVSGFPALLYQVVWQRTLFSIFGVNIESVTVVVTAFMLGLGLGSMLGGWLSTRPSINRLAMFGVVEIGIAAFGLISLPLFHWVAGFTAGVGAAATFLITFTLILFPTILMGATLPVLTTELVLRSGNVGRSVGMLYFANTLGSALACFAAALYTMPLLGMSGSVYLAASLNVSVGLAVLLLRRIWPAGREAPSTGGDGVTTGARLPLAAGMMLVAVAGFVSLGYEIVWYRVYSFVTGGSPRCFSFVLGAFLGGIAFGSLWSRKFCRKHEPLLNVIAALVPASALLSFAVAPLLSYAALWEISYEFTLPLVALAAGTLGAVFPMISQITVASDSRAGAWLSYLYLTNIIGSAAGSYFMGFVLMDAWPLWKIALLLAFLGFGTSTAILVLGQPRRWPLTLAGMAVIACLALMGASGFYDGLYERLQFKDEYEPGNRFVDIVETRSGVVTTDKNQLIYGGGARDGILRTDLLTSDSVIRPFSLSYFHPAPRQVLLIGVAGGAWSQIVGNHPQLENAVAVEINPGYLRIIARYPSVAPLLQNPKVQVVVDDGRRWMLAHRERRFDAILMDTSQHWRANVTNLLSVEMLNLVRSMLNPGGILYYNTTYSGEAQLTGITVFPYALRFGPFLAVSDAPLQLDEGRWRKILLEYKLNGKLVLEGAAGLARLDQVAAYLRKEDATGSEQFAVEGVESIRKRTSGARVITDDNMASEWSR